MQNLSPIGWALRPLRNYANFAGRASRAEFWWYLLFVALGYFALWMIGFAVSGSRPTVGPESTPLAMYTRLGSFLAVIGIYWLGLLIPTIALTVRRLHDTNRSGWWLGAYVVLYVIYLGVVMSMGRGAGATPGVGTLVLVLVMSLAFLTYAIMLMVFYCLSGTRGNNRFGADPYGANVEEVFA
jgi:uncharacterized membrane protein YhaH (DUF805 family)